ncbi:MAG: GGDEF domain-containing protein, partial [Micromonosporaceae bacterium]|nr:GGDEF domain-containing protein [Micromonosporaceae bacterium]
PSWTPWLLLAVSQLVYACADISFYIAHYLIGSTAFPSLPDALYLGHYPLAVAGLILLIRRRAPGCDLPCLVDAAMLAVAAGLVLWLVLIGPQSRAEMTLIAKVTTVAYPVMDLALLAVGLRLVLGPGRRSASFFLLCGYLAAILTADTLYSLQQLHGNYLVGNYLDLLWLTGNLLLGAAALHPTARHLGMPPQREEQCFSPLRMAAVTAAGLIGPVTLMADEPPYRRVDVVVTAGCCGLLFLLAVVRMYGLFAEQRRIAVTDELTGLSTRRSFQTRLAAEEARLKRGSDGVAIFMIDVDHFKRINDEYGHPAGDRALAEIADRLRSVADPGDLLARYGGEEFALLMTAVPAEDVPAMCELVRRRVADHPIQLEAGLSVRVTVSIGAASHPLHGNTTNDLVQVADKALYWAKARGRDRAVVGFVPQREAECDSALQLPVTELSRSD